MFLKKVQDNHLLQFIITVIINIRLLKCIIFISEYPLDIF
jgi:hypothetical protein